MKHRYEWSVKFSGFLCNYVWFTIWSLVPLPRLELQLFYVLLYFLSDSIWLTGIFCSHGRPEKLFYLQSVRSPAFGNGINTLYCALFPSLSENPWSFSATVTNAVFRFSHLTFTPFVFIFSFFFPAAPYFLSFEGIINLNNLFRTQQLQNNFILLILSCRITVLYKLMFFIMLML